MSIDFAKTSFVDKLFNGLSGWVAESDVGLDFSDKVGSGFVDSDEGSVVELS